MSGSPCLGRKGGTPCGGFAEGPDGLCRRCRGLAAARHRPRDLPVPVPPEAVVPCRWPGHSCDHAVVAPGALCHRHGGPPEASLGPLSYLDAVRLAQEGQCRRPPSAWWDRPGSRYESCEGELTALLAEDPALFLDAWAALSPDALANLGAANRAFVLAQHLATACYLGIERPLPWALRRASTPHASAAAWAAAGRRRRPAALWVATAVLRPDDAIAAGAGEDPQSFCARVALTCAEGSTRLVYCAEELAPAKPNGLGESAAGGASDGRWQPRRAQVPRRDTHPMAADDGVGEAEPPGLVDELTRQLGWETGVIGELVTRLIAARLGVPSTEQCLTGELVGAGELRAAAALAEISLAGGHAAPPVGATSAT